MATHPHAFHSPRRDLMVAAVCALFVAIMVGAAFAAVPFYRWFCQTTGFGGTTRIATSAPAGVIARSFEVRFDANVNAGLPWRFTPVDRSLRVKAGEVTTAFFIAENISNEDTVGIATFNVVPEQTGAYFNKIQCFCFSEQRLGPHERAEMPVLFFVDPEIDKDAELAAIRTITLSYTFFPDKDAAPAAPAAARVTN